MARQQGRTHTRGRMTAHDDRRDLPRSHCPHCCAADPRTTPLRRGAPVRPAPTARDDTIPANITRG